MHEDQEVLPLLSGLARVGAVKDLARNVLTGVHRLRLAIGPDRGRQAHLFHHRVVKLIGQDLDDPAFVAFGRLDEPQFIGPFSIGL